MQAFQVASGEASCTRHSTRAVAEGVRSPSSERERNCRSVFLWEATSTASRQRLDCPPEEWAHLAGTCDGEELAIYINGVLENTHRMSPIVRGSGGDLTFGADSDGSGPHFRRQIDEMRIRKIARTQEELDALATVPLFRNEDGLRAYFRFDESDGKIVT